MGFLMMILTAVGGFIGAIFLGLVKDEAAAWLPAINRAIIRAALLRLPTDKRDDYRAEWEADLSEFPGKLSQFVRALGFLKASGDMQIFPEEVAHKTARWFGVASLAVAATNWLVDSYVTPSNLVIAKLPWLDQGLLFANYMATMGFGWAAYRMIRMRATLMKR